MAQLTTIGPRNRFNLLYWSLAALSCGTALWLGNTIMALAVIVLFGLPHGALDGEMARQKLRPSFGPLWFPVFALPYLLLVLLVLLSWRLFPVVTLNLFLALSLWHFGTETREGSNALPDLLVLGGAPLILPSVFHPDATALLLSAMAPPSRLDMPPAWLVWLFPVWSLVACAWLGASPAQERFRRVFALIGLLALFAALPPLQAFMIYFVFQHAPAHVASLIRDPTWPRLVSQASALHYALPLTIATLAIGAALYPLYTGMISERLLALTFQLLAALTLPHMLFALVLESERAALSR
ncbi:hypothetical protein C0V97_10805 [Asaia sp. W19]|uniref:Brp/Blh family beta-carotene 15,15'-dioxygenase n=1 Tax=unclassified Asaia TaxID=2685023 RepID=UPI000F8E0CBC|nr:Brp/Blh family beta-carotene 15,15'-dioxygenase [Asaia sp. W19]RUT25607.1 hypothetical protein C0V97_10805 [Asaia sp. W19]